MDNVQKSALDHFDRLIEQGGAIQSMRESAPFILWLSILRAIKKESLEKVLEGAGNRDELIGFAKASNYAINFIETLANEGTVALERKQQLLGEIRETEMVEATNYAQMRANGYGTI